MSDLDQQELETGGQDFWDDAGPAFSPESSPEAPEGDAAGDPDSEPGWTAEAVEEALKSIQVPIFNGMVNWAFGVEDVDWTHREARLKQVAPAIAREWNKIPQMRSLAGETDRAVIAWYMAEYIFPRAAAIKAERKEHREAEEAEQGDYVYDTTARDIDPDDGEPTNEAGPRVTGLPPRR